MASEALEVDDADGPPLRGQLVDCGEQCFAAQDLIHGYLKLHLEGIDDQSQKQCAEGGF